MPIRSSRWMSADVPFSPARSPVFYGWVVMFAATVGIVLSIPGQTMGVSVFTELLMEHLGLSRVQLSAAYLVGTLTSGLLLPWGGRWFDRLGARGTATLISALFGLSLMYMSVSDRIAAGIRGWVGGWAVSFLVISVGFLFIRFLGQGMLTLASRAMIGKWFNRRRGMAMAISGVATSFSFSVAPRVLDALIEQFTWRGAWQVMGTVTLFGLTVFCWLLFRDNPEECGLVMDGGETLPVRHEESIIQREFTHREAIRTYTFWIYNLVFSFQGLFGTAYTFHVLSIGAYAGLPKSHLLNLFIPTAVVSVCTNLLAGWASDRMRLHYLVVLLSAASGVAAIGMMTLHTAMGQALLVVGFGVAGGCFSMLTGVSWPRFFGRKHLGAISGFSMSSIVIGSAIGPFLFSMSEQYLGSYRPVVLLCAVIPAVLAVGGWWARNPQLREPRPPDTSSA